MLKTDRIGPVHKFRMARTILGRGLYFTTAYWVDGLLIDAGCAHALPEFLRALKSLEVRVVVNSHSHEDHIAANGPLQQSLGLEVLAHPLALPVLADPRGRQPLRLYQKIMWGYPEPSHGTPVGPWVETPHHRFEVIHTPGHSPDHICLYEPHRGWLFTGDAYVGGRDRTLRADYNIWGILASLRELSRRRIWLLFPASGSVRENGNRALEEKIGYLERLGERVLRLHHQGAGIREIRKRILGSEPLIAYITLGHFSGKGLIRSFIEDHPP